MHLKYLEKNSFYSKMWFTPVCLNLVESKEDNMVGPVVGGVVGGISAVVASVLIFYIRRRYKCVVREEGT